MHFLLDFISFSVCHFQVSRLGESGQRALMLSPSPIATALRSFARRDNQASTTSQSVEP